MLLQALPIQPLAIQSFSFHIRSFHLLPALALTIRPEIQHAILRLDESTNLNRPFPVALQVEIGQVDVFALIAGSSINGGEKMKAVLLDRKICGVPIWRGIAWGWVTDEKICRVTGGVRMSGGHG